MRATVNTRGRRRGAPDRWVLPQRLDNRGGASRESASQQPPLLSRSPPFIKVFKRGRSRRRRRCNRSVSSIYIWIHNKFPFLAPYHKPPLPFDSNVII